MNEEIVVFWFRRDLRIKDNTALYNALISGCKVLPIYIFDDNLSDSIYANSARVNIIYNQLKKINSTFKKSNSSIQIFKKTPLEVFEKLTLKYRVKSIYVNNDYEPYELSRDNEINNFLNVKGINFVGSKDQVVFEKNDILKQDNTPYLVFTPYANKWISTLNDKLTETLNSEDFLNNLIKIDAKIPSLSELGFSKTDYDLPKINLTENLLDNYKKTRDFPSLSATSNLSIYLRYGFISVRECVRFALTTNDKTFLKELIWREFFKMILYHYPKTITDNFKPKYNSINWINNLDDIELWKNGKTGYPIVDAGMRQLNKTGLMHNRVRMICASFLCKHLLTHWSFGEAYFAEKLLDFDLALNVGNWQWSAGTGVDSAPYFRIFNPTEQVKKFDKEFKYINNWVNDLQEISYPKPCINHKEARDRALKIYKIGLNN